MSTHHPEYSPVAKRPATSRFGVIDRKIVTLFVGYVAKTSDGDGSVPCRISSNNRLTSSRYSRSTVIQLAIVLRNAALYWIVPRRSSAASTLITIAT